MWTSPASARTLSGCSSSPSGSSSVPAQSVRCVGAASATHGRQTWTTPPGSSSSCLCCCLHHITDARQVQDERARRAGALRGGGLHQRVRVLRLPQQHAAAHQVRRSSRDVAPQRMPAKSWCCRRSSAAGLPRASFRRCTTDTCRTRRSWTSVWRIRPRSLPSAAVPYNPRAHSRQSPRLR